MNTSRRKFMRAGAGALAVAAPMLNFGSYRVFAASQTTYSAKAIDLVNRSLVIDMLSIMAPMGQMFEAMFSGNPKTDDPMRITEAHLHRMLECGIDVFHPAVGIGGQDEALAFVGRLNGYAAQYPKHICRVDSMEDFDAMKAEDKIGFIIGIQNADHFKHPDDVNYFFDLGQRVSQLTYNSRNLIGTGSTDRVDGGLSDFGVAIVERMNQVGMAVDVSHCGDQTSLDAFEVSKKPVLVTHSNVRALVPGHPRCKPDKVIRAVKDNGSVFGITGVRNFVRDKEPTTIEHMLDHFDYVAKMIGVEHLGVGSDIDLDGYDDIPEGPRKALSGSYKSSYAFREKMDTDGYDHAKRIYDLTEGLIRRGYSDADIELVLGGNFKRVLGEIWQGLPQG